MSAYVELSEQRARLLGLLTFALILFWAVFGAYAVHASLPSNALHLPYEKSFHLRFWFPQHWSFFTSEPREVESVQFFRRSSESKWELVSTGPHFTFSDAYGLIRRGWAQGMEAADLMDKLQDVQPLTCHDEIASCLAQVQIASHIDNDYPKRTLCGDITFVSSKPVPWTWMAKGEATHMPAKLTRARVECP